MNISSEMKCSHVAVPPGRERSTALPGLCWLWFGTAVEEFSCRARTLGEEGIQHGCAQSWHWPDLLGMI